MKTKITETNDKELMKMLGEKQAELAKIKFGSAGTKQKNVKLSRTTRRQIAQILTKLSASAK